MLSTFRSSRALKGKFAFTPSLPRILRPGACQPTALRLQFVTSSRSFSSTTPGIQDDKVNNEKGNSNVNKIAPPPPLQAQELCAIQNSELIHRVPETVKFNSREPTKIKNLSREQLKNRLDEAFLDPEKSQVLVESIDFAMGVIAYLIKYSKIPSRIGSTETLYDDVIKFQSSQSYKERVSEIALFFYAIENSPDEEIWASLYHLVSASSPVKILLANRLDLEDVISDLRLAWDNQFYGRSLAALKEIIQRYETKTKTRTQYYAKLIPIIQSSGTGKSRLIDEIGKIHLCASFVFRGNGESGYPPGDPEITKFLKRALVSHAPPHSAYSYMLAFLGGVFKYLIDWVKVQDDIKSEACLASLWHDMMVPRKEISLEYESDLSNVISQTRSPERIKFCQEILKNAQATLSQLDKDEEWKAYVSKKPVVYSGLGKLQAIQTFVSLANEFFAIMRDKAGPEALFLISLDEYSHLYNEGHGQLYPALRHFLYELRALPIWTFVLSTQSSMELLAQSSSQDPSDRISSGLLKRYDPFLALESNLGLAASIAKDRGALFQKPLSQFSTVQHMTLFGRPLWEIWRHRDPEALRSIILKKLFGGGRKGFYNPSDMHHVFAALASRISLDPCLNKVESTANILGQRAVRFHLRSLVYMDYDSRRFITKTPPEPLVSDAVASTLAWRDTNHNTNWSKSIPTLVQNLLCPGLIEKGLKGELYIRLLLVLARDLMLSTKASKSSHGYPYSKPFTMLEYFEGLFSPDIFQKIKDIVPCDKTKDTQEQAKLQDAFAHGWCNFSHFANIDYTITQDPNGIREVLHMCMMQNAALQCAFHQEAWDIIIPVYFGDPGKKFDRRKISAILVQVKFRGTVVKLDLKKEKMKSLLLEHFGMSWGQPILSIVLNVGSGRNVRSALVASSSSCDQVYGFTVTGAGAKIYGSVIDSKHHTACDDLLQDLKEDMSDTLHHQICKTLGVPALSTPSAAGLQWFSK